MVIRLMTGGGIVFLQAAIYLPVYAVFGMLGACSAWRSSRRSCRRPRAAG